jgi:bifunctional enzyme CysN/CysC
MAVPDGILRVLACGSVDDGKSTLIGHLLHLTGNLYDDHRQVLEAESPLIGTAGGAIDYSLLLDGLLAEREQGITIDVAYRYFTAAGRKFIVADTPGHERYTRNMATGASRCEAALILVDACQGLLPQTRRHALICGLMGIRHLFFVVNKMDRAAWDEGVFRTVAAQCAGLAGDLAGLGLSGINVNAVPVSALHGDNLVTLSERMPWYRGATVFDWLLKLQPDNDQTLRPFRFPVQHVIKAARTGDHWQRGVEPEVRQDGAGTRRAYAGTVVAGRVALGDPVVILPAATPTVVNGIRSGNCFLAEATAGMSVALEVAGEHDIVRGDCLADASNCSEVAALFKVRLVWMAEAPLYAGRQYLFRGVCGTAGTEITRIRDRIDLNSCRLLATDRLELNDIGETELTLSRALPFDPYHENRQTGGFILIDRVSNATVACGMILHSLRRGTNVHWQREEVDRDERAALKGQRPRVIWLTGLSGSGKSTIANSLEQKLHDRGMHTMLLDGDNVRHGLNKDLGFTEADRVENIRRIGEVAKLMTDAGLVVITAFISPYRAERDLARSILPAGEFLEVFVDAPLALCEERDPKGLYRKARQGLIPNFTGISAPYEAPAAPELHLDTARLSAGECAEAIISLMEQR